MSFKFSIRDQTGFSLLSSIVAIAIVAVITPIIADYAQKTIKISSLQGIKGDYEDLRRLIRGRVDCAKTVTPPPACPSSGYIDVLNGANAVVFSSQITDRKNYVGSYHIRASCRLFGSTGQKVIEFEARKEDFRVNGNSDVTGTAAHHPLTDQPMEWVNLFEVPFCVVP